MVGLGGLQIGLRSSLQCIIHGEAPSAHGLVLNYQDQGYIIYLDNLYTLTSLFLHLLECKTLASGTTCKNRHGFLTNLKDTQWGKKSGDVLWLRDQHVLYLQWFP